MYGYCQVHRSYTKRYLWVEKKKDWSGDNWGWNVLSGISVEPGAMGRGKDADRRYEGCVPSADADCYSSFFESSFGTSCDDTEQATCQRLSQAMRQERAQEANVKVEESSSCLYDTRHLDEEFTVPRKFVSRYKPNIRSCTESCMLSLETHNQFLLGLNTVKSHHFPQPTKICFHAFFWSWKYKCIDSTSRCKFFLKLWHIVLLHRFQTEKKIYESKLCTFEIKITFDHPPHRL